jgi:hypothetical protein
VQGSLFDALPPEQCLRRKKLMGVLDKSNGKWSSCSIGLGVIKNQKGGFYPDFADS